MSIDYSVPSDLNRLLSEEDYQQIVDYTVDYLQANFTNVHLENGQITVKDNQESTRITNLINLVKNILSYEKAEWQKQIVEYLQKFDRDEDLENYLYTDFELAQNYLTVRLQPQGVFENPDYPDMSIKDYIYQIDLEDLYTVLAFDMPNRYALIRRDRIEQWQVSDVNLLTIAQQNVSSKLEGISCQEIEVEGSTIITMFDQDYSASVAVDFNNNCNACIGSLGSIVCFPSRGSVFIHSIETSDAFNIAYNWLVEQTNTFYSEEPGPLTRNLYWYYDNKFEKFKITRDQEYLVYNIPEQLVTLLD